MKSTQSTFALALLAASCVTLAALDAEARGRKPEPSTPGEATADRQTAPQPTIVRR